MIITISVVEKQHLSKTVNVPMTKFMLNIIHYYIDIYNLMHKVQSLLQSFSVVAVFIHQFIWCVTVRTSIDYVLTRTRHNNHNNTSYISSMKKLLTSFEHNSSYLQENNRYRRGS